MTLFGAIEAGGTKFVCVVGSGPNDIRARTRFPTTMPEETLGQAITFFREYPEPIAALGVGSFGPVDLDQSSPTYGYVTTTPKLAWRGTDICGPLRRALNIPIAFENDVNTAAIGEQRWGVAQGLQNALYVTVGTGIGGGALVAGRPVHGLVHPEIGHVRIPHDLQADPFPGICPSHGDCLEGLASGPAIMARWGQAGAALPANHPAWELEARYLALGLVACILTLSPQRIIMGGGVMQQEHLFPLIRQQVQELLNGYVAAPAVLDHIDTYIVPPGLGGDAGVLGALALAQEAVG